VIVALFDEASLQPAIGSASATRSTRTCANLYFIPATTPVSKAFRTATVALR